MKMIQLTKWLSPDDPFLPKLYKMIKRDPRRKVEIREQFNIFKRKPEAAIFCDEIAPINP